MELNFKIYLADEAPAEPKIGERLRDGTIYAGTSPDTGQPIYTTPSDAPLMMTFNQAADYAVKFAGHRHQDWRVPTKNELNVLLRNRALIDGFNANGSYPAGWYWSATPFLDRCAWCRHFSDGGVAGAVCDDHLSLRCVRSGASP